MNGSNSDSYICWPIGNIIDTACGSWILAVWTLGYITKTD
jgi:hypothetical protein